MKSGVGEWMGGGVRRRHLRSSAAASRSTALASITASPSSSSSSPATSSNPVSAAPSSVSPPQGGSATRGAPAAPAAEAGAGLGGVGVSCGGSSGLACRWGALRLRRRPKHSRPAGLPKASQARGLPGGWPAPVSQARGLLGGWPAGLPPVSQARGLLVAPGLFAGSGVWAGFSDDPQRAASAGDGVARAGSSSFSSAATRSKTELRRRRRRRRPSCATQSGRTRLPHTHTPAALLSWLCFEPYGRQSLAIVGPRLRAPEGWHYHSRRSLLSI